MKQFTVSTLTHDQRTAIQALFRQVWLLLLCCALSITAFAQDGAPDDDDETYEIDSIGMEQWFDALTSSLAELIPDCYPVSFSKKIPVLFENSFALYLETAGHAANTLFLTNVTAGGTAMPIAVEGGRAIIRGLPYNQQFLISGMNSCGEMEHSFSFFTNEQALTEEEGNRVVFSEEMFLLAAAFGVQNSKGDIGGCKTPARTAECKDVEVVIPRHYNGDDGHPGAEPGTISAAVIFNAQGQMVKSLR
jgi:hypothetical protein